MLFSDAIAVLRLRGLRVAPSEIPGLTWVDGRELTMSQVINLAQQWVSQ